MGILYFCIDYFTKNLAEYMGKFTSLKGKTLAILWRKPNYGGKEMKSFASFFMSFVLTAAMLTGCGCTNRNAGATTAPSIQPTTGMTTVPTTAPTQQTTVPATTDETINHGNGPLVEDTTGPSESTTETGDQSRSRNMPIQ